MLDMTTPKGKPKPEPTPDNPPAIVGDYAHEPSCNCHECLTAAGVEH
jgi:hypothetical protein